MILFLSMNLIDLTEESRKRRKSELSGPWWGSHTAERGRWREEERAGEAPVNTSAWLMSFSHISPPSIHQCPPRALLLKQQQILEDYCSCSSFIIGFTCTTQAHLSHLLHLLHIGFINQGPCFVLFWQQLTSGRCWKKWCEVFFFEFSDVWHPAGRLWILGG